MASTPTEAVPPPPQGHAVAAAFGIEEPAEPYEAVTTGSADAWRVRTGAGDFFLKRLRRVLTDDWVEHATGAMDFERAAIAAGVPMPRPVEPRDPWRGYASLIDGHPYRLYAWADGRPATPQDDLAQWLGATMARLHAVATAGAPERWLYGLHPIDDWRAWATEGAARSLPWAEPLAAALPTIEERSVQIEAALDQAGDFVMTHRDVEPWNVMVTEHGPMLFDLDGAGPDSATLEFNHAALQFALWGRDEPDRGALERTIEAYAGPLRPVATPFARRIGIKLNRLSWHLFISLGHRPWLADKAAAATAHAAESLAELPVLLQQLDAWTPRYSELAAQHRGMVE